MPICVVKLMFDLDDQELEDLLYAIESEGWSSSVHRSSDETTADARAVVLVRPTSEKLSTLMAARDVRIQRFQPWGRAPVLRVFADPELPRNWDAEIRSFLREIWRAPTPPPPPSDLPNGAYFISYAREDRSYARRLHQLLLTCGATPWYDADLTTGSDWGHEVVEGIRTCSAFIPLMSRHSKGSTHCTNELLAAINHDCIIVPVSVDGTIAFHAQNLNAFVVEDHALPPRTWVTALRERVGGTSSDKTPPCEGMDLPPGSP